MLLPLVVIFSAAVMSASEEPKSPDTVQGAATRAEAPQPKEDKPAAPFQLTAAASSFQIRHDAPPPDESVLENPQPVTQQTAGIEPKTPSQPLRFESIQRPPLQVSLVKQSSQPLPELKTWDLKVEDRRLDQALERWARDAGYNFRWDADRYLLISAPTQFKGTLVQAVNELLQTPGILYSDYPLEACIYANEPPLLRITRLGDQSQECR